LLGYKLNSFIMIDFDPIEEYLKYKYNDKSIFVLEEIMADNWYETIIHFGNDNEESRYQIINYKELDIFERTFKIKKIISEIR
jgi:hypothetical protein